MGYRSDVVISMNRDAFQLFLNKIKEQEAEKQEQMIDFINDASFFLKPEGDVLFHWEYIKWYDSYFQVEFFETFVHAINNEEEDYIGDNLEVCLLRLGEEQGDVEDVGNFKDSNAFDAKVIRLIEFDAGSNDNVENAGTFFKKLLKGKENDEA